MDNYELPTPYEDHIYEAESPMYLSLPQKGVVDLNKPKKMTRPRNDEYQKTFLVSFIVISVVLCAAIITFSVLIYFITDKIDQLQMISYKTGTRFSKPNTSLQGTTIAFPASLKYNLHNLRVNQDILFETVDNNVGQAFHPETGVFSCPQNGVYAFFLTILCYPNTRVESKIVKNGITLTASYSHSRSSRLYGTGSTSVVVRLETGDKVWVQVNGINGTGNMIYNGYSSFMGFSLMLE